MATLANHIPTLVVLALVLGDILRQRVQGEVRGVVCQVEEKGAIFVGFEGLIDELRRVIGKRDGGVEIPGLAMDRLYRCPHRREGEAAGSMLKFCLMENRLATIRPWDHSALLRLLELLNDI